MQEHNRQNHNHQPITPSVSRRRLLGLAAGAGVGLFIPPSAKEGYESSAKTNEYIRGTPWEVNFQEMPDGPLDPTQWNFAEGGKENYNGEVQSYTSRPKNIRVENGELVIEAHSEEHDGQPFTSARINTLGIFDFTYGTIEVTAALPYGVGTWPAAWLMPSNPRYDPRELGVPEGDRHEFAVNGEIDFLEAIGRHPGENIPGAHSYNQLKEGTLYTPAKIDDPYNEFHRYGLIKKPGSLEFTVDGEIYANRIQESDDPLWWPYEQSYYLILNSAMGGTWAGAEKDTYPPHGIDMSMQEYWKYRISKISYEPLEQ